MDREVRKKFSSDPVFWDELLEILSSNEKTKSSKGWKGEKVTMKRTWNKVLSWLLTMVMLVTSFEGFTVPVLAEDSTTLSVNAISANGFADNGKDGKSAADALSVSVNAGDELIVSFNSAVVSGNTVSSDTVSWNLLTAADEDPTAALTALGLIATPNGNNFEVSSNAAISGNASFKLTASFNGATPDSQEIYFDIVVNAVEETTDPIQVSANKINVSANGFEENGKDGSSLANAYSVSVSVNDAVNVSFNATVVSSNGNVLSDTVSFNLTAADGSAAELPAGLTPSISGNEYAISGNATASVNASYKLSVSCDGADTEEVFFTIIVGDEEETPEPVSENKITISANGFDDNGKDGSSSENALSVTVSLNEAVNVSFNAAVVSANGTVSADAVVSWNLVSANGVSANLPEALKDSVSGNVFTISGNVTASVNATYKLTASFNGLEKDIFFTIVAEDKVVTPDPVSSNKVTLSANGFEDNSKGLTPAAPLTKTVSLNAAISLSLVAATVSSNGDVVSGNTVSFNLVNADGSAATLLEGLTASANGNLFHPHLWDYYNNRHQ